MIGIHLGFICNGSDRLRITEFLKLCLRINISDLTSELKRKKQQPPPPTDQLSWGMFREKGEGGHSCYVL